MLSVYPRPASAEAQPIWLDLLDPTPAELAQVEKMAGGVLPSREDLNEIERSSRLKVRDGVLSMSVPMVTHLKGSAPQAAPVGFILSRKSLVTVRFATLQAFDAVAGRFQDEGARPTSSLETFVGLCDEIIDRLADSLEHAAADLRTVSARAFHVADGQGRNGVLSNRIIRGRLRQLGQLGDQLSETRDVLLGLGRAVDFACEMTSDWPDSDKMKRGMNTLKKDVASLDEYEIHLADKVQFLLDAMVGLIGIAQNDLFKVLTVVSIVGIPPTLVAGIYGMNFKTMPEYDWAFGYPYGLAVITLSAIAPLAWFKWRGWF